MKYINAVLKRLVDIINLKLEQKYLYLNQCSWIFHMKTQ